MLTSKIPLRTTLRQSVSRRPRVLILTFSHDGVTHRGHGNGEHHGAEGLVALAWYHSDMPKPDHRIDTREGPSHDDLWEREQRYLLRAIDDDIDLSDRMNDGGKSLKIRARRGSLHP